MIESVIEFGDFYLSKVTMEEALMHNIRYES
jgi:hypothetical protein